MALDSEPIVETGQRDVSVDYISIHPDFFESVYQCFFRSRWGGELGKQKINNSIREIGLWTRARKIRSDCYSATKIRQKTIVKQIKVFV